MELLDLKCDKGTGHVELVNGDLALVSGVEELQQRLLTRLRWFYGEYPFNTSIGIRYFEDVLVKNPNLPNIETLLKSAIAETVGVEKIISFQLSYDPSLRKASLTFEVDSAYGNVELNNIVLGA